MNYKTYFKKYGKVYGVSYKYDFGKWTGYINEFKSLEEAEEWLHTEGYDFRTRELGSLSYCKSCISNA